MKLFIVATLLTLVSFKPISSVDDLSIRTNYPKKTILSVGDNIFQKANKKKLEESLSLYLKDEKNAEQIQKILEENKFEKQDQLCQGIYDTDETIVINKPFKKGSLCSFNNNIKTFSLFTKYFLIYDCNSGKLYYVQQISM
jgi:hypothetical protein